MLPLQGLDLVAVVSTGVEVWELRVSGQLYNNTWVQIGLRWTLPDLSKPQLATSAEGREKMGGLEMFIGGAGDGGVHMVGQTILPDSTDRGSTKWTAQPVLLEGGKPVMMLGCHQNSDRKGFTGFAGTRDAPAMFDELAIWDRRLGSHELNFFLGGYEADFESINADQFKSMLGNVDLGDAEQAGAAQAVVEAMLVGPPTTLPPFPTRTPLPTTTSTTLEPISTTTATTTTEPPLDEAGLRKTMLGRQTIMTSMLKLDNVEEGQDPVSVQGRFGMTKLAAAIMAGTEENRLHWEAVHKEHQHLGPMKTAKELEEYMLAWVGAVNTSAYDEENPNWKTAYFDSADQTMRYYVDTDDMVMNVDKLPFDMVRSDGKVRLQYPDYSGMEWDTAKAEWDNVKDNFTVPTGMYMDVPGCSSKPMSILTAVYNGLPELVAKRRNPVTIKSKNFFIDSKVISVRTKINADPMTGDIEDTYVCEPDKDYMASNPVRLVLYHKKPQKSKRTLLWHSDDYWSGLEVRHCVYWNEKFGFNGAWDDVMCKVLNTDDEKTECECAAIGSYAVLSEMLNAPNPADKAMWILVLKWMGIIIGTILLTVFSAVVFLSVVVGEMFHQLRMYTCISYMIANILMLLGDTTLCEDRHNNMALSMCLIYFFQAALWWNMCEAHATFKGITAGLINGRTSVYHPIAWGGPLICLGFLCFMYGELLGTDPSCFVSWENVVIEKFFYYNTLTILITAYFEIIIMFNVVRVQSHNKETVMYLKDQVNGLGLTSFLMALLWSYKMLGWLSYYKDPTVELPNMMPLFQIFNGWFGVIMFLTLGMWSKRFRIGLRSQAEEKKRMMQEKSGKPGGEENLEEKPLGSPEDGATPAASSPTSPAASRPVSAAPQSEDPEINSAPEETETVEDDPGPAEEPPETEEV